MNEREALIELRRVKNAYQNFIRDNFEFAAADCRICPTIGVCCTDAHFVNVHITRLEAVVIRESIENNSNLTQTEKQTIFARIAEVVEKYNLSDSGDTFQQTYACPLFAPPIGCLIHADGAKPAPCIQHACYEKQTDLPPDCLQDLTEKKIEKLNREVYGEDWRWSPLPLAISKNNAK